MIKKSALLLILCLASVALLHAQKKGTSFSKINNVFSVKVNNASEKMNLTVKGDVTLGDDDKSIVEISPKGSIEYRIKKQFLEVANGKGTFIYTINGIKKTNPGGEDNALIEECVKTMIDHGIDAPNRVKRIFASGGTSAVLNEISRFKSDYVKEMYLSSLFKDQQLSKSDMIALLNKTDQHLSSDYYKSTLLNGIMTSFLKDEATADAYLNAVAHLKSDYYQSNSIKNLLKTSLKENQFDKVISIVGDMKSDYYQSEVLKGLFNNTNISDGKISVLMNTLAKMKSDYYKSEIISALLTNTAFSSNRYSQTIAATQGMKSDYYQSEILKKLISRDVKDESEWSKLIQYAGNINSDYYQSEVLIKIAAKMPGSESLKKQFDETAKKIKSDVYYGKIVRETGR